MMIYSVYNKWGSYGVMRWRFCPFFHSVTYKQWHKTGINDHDIVPLKLHTSTLTLVPDQSWLPFTAPLLFFLLLNLIIIECQCLAPGVALTCPVLLHFLSWRTVESQIQSAHTGLSLSLACTHLIPASSVSTSDRTSLGTSEPGLQHQPDHRQPGVEPAGRRGRAQRRHVQGHMPALQLGTGGMRPVRAQCGVLPRAVGISGHVRDRRGPARPRKLHFRGGGGQWSV